MSPTERSRSQPGSEKSTHRIAKDNVKVSIPVSLRPLAPKTAPRFRPLAIRGSSDFPFHPAQGQPPDANRERTDNRCAVCFKRDCSLLSHQLHNDSSSSRRQSIPSALQAPIPQDSFSASYSLKIAALYDDPSPSPTNLTLLNQLPIPSDLNRRQMHRLFHDWFVIEAPNHFTAPRPLHVKADLLHSPFLAPAFTDPVLCLSVFTISAASQRQAASNPNNVLALTLCDRAMRTLRERINADRDTVTDTTVVAATYLWAANLYLADDESLQQHASSVRALVEARQHLQNSGLSEAAATLFKWVDIMNTLRLNRPSQFPDDRCLITPASIVTKSGGAWQPSKAQQVPISDQAVILACCQCCQLIDLLDQSDGQDQDREASTYLYLFQKVGQLYQENSILRAKYFNTGTLEECVVLATDVLKLLVFNGGWNRSSRRALKLQAHYLSTAIQATGGGNFWRPKLPMFAWIVFLVFVAKPTGEDLKWSTYVLRGALEHVFGPRTTWSDETVDELQEMLFTFGWSHTEPLGDLDSLCEQLWT